MGKNKGPSVFLQDLPATEYKSKITFHCWDQGVYDIRKFAKTKVADTCLPKLRLERMSDRSLVNTALTDDGLDK